jgi:hypothetical protein
VNDASENPFVAYSTIGPEVSIFEPHYPTQIEIRDISIRYISMSDTIIRYDFADLFLMDVLDNGRGGEWRESKRKEFYNIKSGTKKNDAK